jgi:hypothetical protein
MIDRDQLAEALDKFEGMPTPDGMYGSEHDAMAAAVRRVLSARPPDYEAAAEAADEAMDGHFYDSVDVQRIAEVIVDAALGGPDRLILDPEET